MKQLTLDGNMLADVIGYSGSICLVLGYLLS